MNRNTWTFLCDSGAVLTAADAKLAYHKKRLAFWQNKKQEVLQGIRESGIEVIDSQADFLSNKLSGSSYRRTQVQIDDKMQENLSECISKEAEHAGHVTQYSGWVQCLRMNDPHVALALHQDDYLFFFGAQPRDDNAGEG